MNLYGLSVVVPGPLAGHAAELGLRLVQEPPGTIPTLDLNRSHHGSGPQQVQAAEIAVLVCLALISAGVMLLTESARRHEHIAPRPRAPVAAQQHHPHRWRRYGILAAVLACLLIAGLLLYPLIAKGL
jgi:hypothetical protein